MRHLLIILFLLISLGTLRVSASNAAGSFDCGVNAAYIILRHAGCNISYAHLYSEFKEQSQPDSLLAIKRVLAANGLAVEAIKAEPKFFITDKGLAIVNLNLTNFG